MTDPMCNCPIDLTNRISCADGATIDLPMDDYDNPAAMAAEHADLVADHGGLRTSTILCTDCGRIYTELEAS